MIGTVVPGADITAVCAGEIVHATVVAAGRMDDGQYVLVTDQRFNGARVCCRLLRKGVTWADGRLAKDSAEAQALLAATAREGEQRLWAKSIAVDNGLVVLGPASSVPLT